MRRDLGRCARHVRGEGSRLREVAPRRLAEPPAERRSRDRELHHEPHSRRHIADDEPVVGFVVQEAHGHVRAPDPCVRANDLRPRPYARDPLRPVGHEIDDHVSEERVVRAVGCGLRPLRERKESAVAHGERVRRVNHVEREEPLEGGRQRREGIVVRDDVGPMGVAIGMKVGVRGCVRDRGVARAVRRRGGREPVRVRRGDEPARRAQCRREITVDGHAESRVLRGIGGNALVENRACRVGIARARAQEPGKHHDDDASEPHTMQYRRRQRLSPDRVCVRVSARRVRRDGLPGSRLVVVGPVRGQVARRRPGRARGGVLPVAGDPRVLHPGPVPVPRDPDGRRRRRARLLLFDDWRGRGAPYDHAARRNHYLGSDAPA